MNAIGEPCPVCRRMDGGHDQTMHDMYDSGAKPALSK